MGETLVQRIALSFVNVFGCSDSRREMQGDAQYIRCAASDCRRTVDKREARNYGAGPVCPDCYERWFQNED